MTLEESGGAMHTAQGRGDFRSEGRGDAYYVEGQL